MVARETLSMTNPMSDKSTEVQAGAIEITSEMIEAGVKKLRANIGDSRWIDGDRDVVRKIFQTMMGARTFPLI